MSSNFWKKLNKSSEPILCLAPMYDVTDVVFREIIAEIAPPDVFFTEFVNVDALVSDGRSAHIKKLDFTENQRPIVAQIWGIKPENFYTIAEELKEMGFDGIDINLGCPQKSVMKIGACAALIENRELTSEIIKATIKGAGGIPVSVKTRTGIKKHITEDWIEFLLSFDLAAIILHGRTVSQMSKVSADWDEIKKAVDIRNALGKDTLIIGNGDVTSYKDAVKKVKEYGVNGAMIGRGVFMDPFAFSKTKSIEEYSVEQRLELMKKHILLFEKTYGADRSYGVLKKFYKIYLKGFSGASELRAKFMETSTVEQALKLSDTSISGFVSS